MNQMHHYTSSSSASAASTGSSTATSMGGSSAKSKGPPPVVIDWERNVKNDPIRQQMQDSFYKIMRKYFYPNDRHWQTGESISSILLSTSNSSSSTSMTSKEPAAPPVVQVQQPFTTSGSNSSHPPIVVSKPSVSSISKPITTTTTINNLPIDRSTNITMEETKEEEEDVDMSITVGEEEQEEDQEMIVEEEEEQTVCLVCLTSEREDQILLCDGCDAEYHLYCLDPPLSVVPEGDWYCPNCVVKQKNVKQEPLTTTTATTITTTKKSEEEKELEQKRCNELLIHACSCDELTCQDPEFQLYCQEMKRFLTSACWASHNAQWRNFPIAQVTAELFAYHTLHCQQKSKSCPVPMCDLLKEQEFV